MAGVGEESMEVDVSEKTSISSKSVDQEKLKDAKNNVEKKSTYETPWWERFFYHYAVQKTRHDFRTVFQWLPKVIPCLASQS